MKNILRFISAFALSIFNCQFSIAEGIQDAWDNPNANMAAGSTKPGYAQLSW